MLVIQMPWIVKVKEGRTTETQASIRGFHGIDRQNDWRQRWTGGVGNVLFLKGIVHMRLRKDFIKISIFVKSLMAFLADS